MNRISIIGLGYVGLPLATAFAKKYQVVGYDVDKSRIKELKKGFDRTREIMQAKLLKNKNLIFTNNFYDMKIPTTVVNRQKKDPLITGVFF